MELSGLEVSLSNVMSREMILKEYVDMLRDHYDYILICQNMLLFLYDT